jgi:hypothetical protein
MRAPPRTGSGRIAGAFPDKPPTEAFGLGAAFPVYWITYREAEGFCRALTVRATSSTGATDWCHVALPGGVVPDVQVKGAPNRDGSYSRVRRGAAWNDDAHWWRSAMRLR